MAGRLKGSVKWFNNSKGYGFITGEDGVDVFVHHSVIAGEGFRSLGEGEAVEYDVVKAEKGQEAANVTGPAGGPVEGKRKVKRGPRRGGDKPERAEGGAPAPAAAGGEEKRERKPRVKRVRCYNCGKVGHVVKECTEETKPKVCFNCEKEGHIKADCPELHA